MRKGFTLISKACILPKISKACERGFTLIELLVVIVIIGILMGILLVSYQGTRRTARDGKRKADLEQIRSALELYHADCGKYPASVSFGSQLSGVEAACSGNVYMTEVPQDPLYPVSEYRYSKGGTDHLYTLCAFLEGGGGTSLCSGGCGGNCKVDEACNYKVCQP